MVNCIARWMSGSDGDTRLPWRIFWTAFAVRVLYITFAHTYRFHPLVDHFQFGWEAGRIARALSTGHGFADPFASSFMGHTGPTAWLPPLYPLLIASVFKLFGVYTPASAWVILTLNSIFSATTALAIWEISIRCFSRRNALWSAWLWALYPAAMQYAVRWIWEMSLTTALFAWLIVLALRMRGVDVNRSYPDCGASTSAQTFRWTVFGLMWGMIALSTSTLLLFLPVCGLWVLIGTWQRPRALRNAILAGLIFIGCLTPWELRNYHVFHTFIPIRGNLGVESYLGNGPGSNGFVMTYHHPNLDPAQFRLYASMGEVRYAKMRGDLAKAYIHAHPAHFLADCLKRVYFFWIGTPSDAPLALELPRMINYSFISLAGLMGLALALWRRVPAAGLCTWAFLLIPIPYYTVMAMSRFRHPLEPLLTIFGVYLFQSASFRHA